MTSVTTSEPLTAERVNELSRNYWNSAVLRAGIKLGIFELLEQKTLTSDDITRELDAAPRFVEAFLEACALLELLDKTPGGFTNSRLGSAFLVPGKEGYVGDLVLHITNYWDTWGKLDQLVVEGRTELPFENDFTGVSRYWTDYMRGQHNRAAAGQARYLVENVELNGRTRMLDLGGGAASYSIALCGANPELQSTVIDAPEPLEIAEPLVEENDLQDQIDLVEGDLFSMDLGNHSDVALISGVVLIKSEDDVRELFQRTYDALEPGGMIVVQDFMRIDYGEERSFLDIMMDLYVLIGFDPEAGDRHGDDYAAWLRDTGFTGIDQIPLPTQLALITATKPA